MLINMITDLERSISSALSSQEQLICIDKFRDILDTVEQSIIERKQHPLEKRMEEYGEYLRCANKDLNATLQHNKDTTEIVEHIKNLNRDMDAFRLMNNVRLGKLIVTGSNGEPVQFTF